MTAALGLFVRIGLDTPPEDGSMAPSKGQVVVINGASSSVGSYGVQLAKHAGYTVVGVARQSADVATELGANKIINYWGKDDSQLVGELKEAVGALGGQLAGALDCVSTTETNLVIAKVVAAFGGGKMSHVLPTDVVKDPSLLPEGVSTLDSAVFDAQDKDAEFAAKWYRLIGKWIDSGKFKPNKVKIVPGGLDGVVEGLKLLENNQVNGVKLVYRISETKST
jgi:NADPH:quinone reductase-like Zn-dependent oxidoreductase